MDINTILNIAALALGGINLTAVLKMMYNHMEHIQAGLDELRKMFVDHLRDHGKDS
jgi:hypothetical protein